MFQFVLVGLGLMNLALLLLLLHNWPKTTRLTRALLGGVVFLWFPLLWGGAVTLRGLEDMKRVEFCGSCHVMEPYLASLNVDDEESLPAIHFQNNYVSRETACFDCHTQYTMFGGVKAKLNGLKHVAVNYFGTIPEKIELYHPYNNRDCLHCHDGGKKYLAQHEDDIADIKSGEYSCLDCHDVGHVLGGAE